MYIALGVLIVHTLNSKVRTLSLKIRIAKLVRAYIVSHVRSDENSNEVLLGHERSTSSIETR